MIKNKAPYPRKCYLPFILYPPGMYRNHEGDKFLDRIDLNKKGDDFVLYIGIPFCRIRCKSCPYFIKILPENDKNNREDIYVDALIKDIINWTRFNRWKTGLVREIYIGGGTGSILRLENLKRIVDTVCAYFNLSKDCGFTLEGNSQDFTEEKMDYVATSAINRISLGVQSFQQEILSVVGSPHAAEDSIRVIKGFQNRGLNNIQIDLMYNMPGHTLDVWKRDLEKITALDIPHFTIYLYRIHDATPQSRLIDKGKVSHPEDPESPMVQAMYSKALEIAEHHGYKMYMVDHFCKPGYENMYNHWNWKAYIDTLAIGPGSYSYFDGYRLGTGTDVDYYVETVNNGNFLISTVTSLMSPRVQRERYIIFAFLYFEIEFKYYEKKFCSSFLEDFSEEVERLLKKGLIEIDKNTIKLTKLGLVWHTNVILEFFNSSFWSDIDALNEPNWSLNGIMVQVGAYPRSYWLGEKDQVLFDNQNK